MRFICYCLLAMLWPAGEESAPAKDKDHDCLQRDLSCIAQSPLSRIVEPDSIIFPSIEKNIILKKIRLPHHYG